MLHPVLAKQPNSSMCLVCGLDNQLGLKAEFFELEGQRVWARFTPRQEHQGYPGRLHGGAAAALMDETIGRAIRLRHGDRLWGVTTEVQLRYRRPAPLEAPLQALGWLTRETRRHFEGKGVLLLPQGEVAIEAFGKYLKAPLENIADFDFAHQRWEVVPDPADPKHVDLPME